MKTEEKKKNLALSCQAAANAKHVLAICTAKHDPDECIYDHESELLNDVLVELPREAVAGIRAADPGGIAKEMKERSLWCWIIEALACGLFNDIWSSGPTREAADRAEAKRRSPKLRAAIEDLAKQVAEILGPSRQAEAYARRWICYAIEGRR